MTVISNRIRTISSFATRASVAVGLIIASMMMLASSASASYEEVGHFADEPGAQQLWFASGLAVNVTGVGGVPPGTFYATSSNGARILRYSPSGELRAVWGWSVADQTEEFQRCGPDGDPSHPTCLDEKKGEGLGRPGEGSGQFRTLSGIAVDQSNGNVYVLSGGGSGTFGTSPRKTGVVQAFSADGSHLVASFGERVGRPEGEPAQSIAETPEKLHSPPNAAGIAVDSSGRVYLTDGDFPTANPPLRTRVMVFEPETPGDYEHYVYAGPANDVGSSARGIHYEPRGVAVDAAGNLYISNENSIFEFSPSDPVKPICTYLVSKGGVVGTAVNELTGEVFFFSEKDNKIHQLSSCAGGEFHELSTIPVGFKPSNISAIAINPLMSFEPSRPSGILYAADALQHSGGNEDISFGIGDIFVPAVVHLPSVESQTVSGVGVSSATLGAQVNPHGSSPRYAFQYLTDAAFQSNEPTDRFAGASESPAGGAAVGSGQAPLSAGTTLLGLLPGTKYHFRVVATSNCEPDTPGNVCVATGPDAIFRTFPTEAVGLPDSRSYEMVSPPQKQAGEVFPVNPLASSCLKECKPGFIGERFPMQSAPDGEAVVYEGFPFSETEGAARFNQYISRRTAAGWQTTTLSPLLQASGGPSGGQGYEGFNSGLDQGLIYQSSPVLSPDGPAGMPNLYLQSSSVPALFSPLLRSEPSSGAESMLIHYAGASVDFGHVFFAANNALTAATAFAPPAVDAGAAKDNLYESFGGELRLVNVLPGNTETAPGALFGAPSGGSGDPQDFNHVVSEDGSRAFWSSEAGQVYVREDGVRTIAIPDPGRFLTASADGAKVLLRNGHLYDLETETTADLTGGQGGFQGIAGQSEDLSHIYFVDTNILTGEASNDQGAKAVAGGFNLYAWSVAGPVFVATLSLPDEGFEQGGGTWKAAARNRAGEASPGGRYLAFLSQAQLTGYENVGPKCLRDTSGFTPKFKTGSCSEVFLYDSTTGKLSCPSCNPGNQKPLGRSTLALIYGPHGALPQPRYMLDSGRLYFDSADSLSQFDSNGGVEDVYQFEPQGVGGCQREEGCVSLISAGSGIVDSNFFATEASGKNVFFTSRDQLSPRDRDDLLDLYDAREGGGIAAESETTRSECQGEACQPVPVAPNDPTPGSSSFEGAGNLNEKAKGKKPHKKHHKKKGTSKKKHSSTRTAGNKHGGAK